MSEGDEGFDPCECIWSHEMAMRRLLSLLRQSQTHCTENECVDEMPGGLPGMQNTPNGFIMMLMCWLAVALVLFLLRPSALRQNDNSKPRDNGPGPSGPPPSTPEVD